MITIEEMAEIYIMNLGFLIACIEVEHLINRVTSYEGKRHWSEVLFKIKEKGYLQ